MCVQALATELERVEKLLKQSLDKEKAMYRRMIDGLGKKEKPSQPKSQSQTVSLHLESDLYN